MKTLHILNLLTSSMILMYMVAGYDPSRRYVFVLVGLSIFNSIVNIFIKD